MYEQFKQNTNNKACNTNYKLGTLTRKYKYTVRGNKCQICIQRKQRPTRRTKGTNKGSTHMITHILINYSDHMRPHPFI